MSIRRPHFLLFAEAAQHPQQNDQWRFVLETVDGTRRITAKDSEPGVDHGRLELLALVRALEAIDGPARVTLVTRSDYVVRGLRRGLTEWRARNWQWERFGQLVPIRDHDLWQRVDRALEFHRVDCRMWRFDDAHTLSDATETADAPNRSGAPYQAAPVTVENPHRPERHRRRNSVPKPMSRRLAAAVDGCRRTLEPALAAS